ncbi:MAG: hypothetical protein MPL62_02450 [Alphaproteobacteria bacterium]|nr:hypothetical protein [Alphaproteobacteria bacterium]
MLDAPPSVAYVGSTIEFSGRLVDSSGFGIHNALIHIKDNDPGFDDDVATVSTDRLGYFSAYVRVKHWDSATPSSEIYAVFEGGAGYSKSRSFEYSVRTVDQGRDAGSGTHYGRMALTLNADYGSVYVGSEVMFTGRLTSGGSPLAGKVVEVKENDPGWFDERLGWTRTDSNGYFALTWTATKGIETDFDIYAVFEGDGQYGKARSAELTVGVHRYGGSITLDRIPREAVAGSILTISGTLRLDGQQTQGKVVYIKDNDRLSRDELLAAAYVDSSGRFEANWRVVSTDPDDVVDIFAVYEGDSSHSRLTTCKNWSCSDTIPLSILEYVPADPPPAPGLQYMELYHPVSFDRSPYVVIVPDPDNYQEVSNGIYPVMEGINLLGERLKQTHGGDWSVEFGLLTQGGTFDRRPDIIIELITPDDDGNRLGEACKDWGGLAWPSTKKPIQSKVCSQDGSGRDMPSSEISRIAMHEFIHTIGLGHTFGAFKQRDLMCSIDSDTLKPTCRSEARGTGKPSQLNLDAIVRLYGADGYKNPNYNVAYKQKFQLGDTYGGGAVEPPRPTALNTAPSGCSSTDAKYDFEVDGKNLDPGWYTWWTLCTGRVIEYHFSTGGQYDSFELFVLPPETDPESFIQDGVGQYYECETEGQTWVSKSGDCSIEPGSNLLLYNPGSRSITIDGSIKTVDPCDDTNHRYDYSVDVSLDPGDYQWWTMCTHRTLEYNFDTGTDDDGFYIFVLPPETAVRSFIDHRIGQYYLCEEYEQGWISMSGSCTVAPGSNIVIHNYESDPITITGWIGTR